MLKNLKLGTKIGGGFGVLILISMLLGGVGIWNMKRVGNIADGLQEEIAPQVDVGVRVERSTLLTMYAMRAFNYTGSDKDMAETEKNLADVEKALAEATVLAQKHDMPKLKENAAKASAKVLEYRGLAKQAKDIDAAKDKNMQIMVATAQEFMKNSSDFRDSQSKQLASELSGKVDAKKLKERVDKVAWINEVIDLGSAVRIANFKSQAQRDDKFALEALKNFDEINKALDKIRSLTRTAENLKQLDEIKAAGASYKTALDEYLKLGEAANEVTRSAAP